MSVATATATTAAAAVTTPTSAATAASVVAVAAEGLLIGLAQELSSAQYEDKWRRVTNGGGF
jgi:ascorbate-specific PTS system EIIC-type component UlaA